MADNRDSPFLLPYSWGMLFETNRSWKKNKKKNIQFMGSLTQCFRTRFVSLNVTKLRKIFSFFLSMLKTN